MENKRVTRRQFMRDSAMAAAGEKKYCTDCHGNHHLAHRKCKWK